MKTLTAREYQGEDFDGSTGFYVVAANGTAIDYFDTELEALEYIAQRRPTMKTIEFNTGRKYTAQGQIVKATLHDDGVVTFFDHSRQVDGEFKLGLHCSFNQVEVMHWYDSGMCKTSRRSWADGMLRGGCNARS